MSGLFRELYLCNLWMVDVVLGNKICTGMPGEETREVIVQFSTRLCTVN